MYRYIDTRGKIHYFSISQKELIHLVFVGFTEFDKAVADSGTDVEKIVCFADLILLSYSNKDGSKDWKKTVAFLHSKAFRDMFDKISDSKEEGAKFVAEILETEEKPIIF